MPIDSAAQTILCVNAGSSSLKFGLYSFEADGRELACLRGIAEKIGASDGRLVVSSERTNCTARSRLNFADHGAACEAINDLLTSADSPRPDGIGHRVVHGGPCYSAPVQIDRSVLDTLKELARFAPLHLPPEIAVIECLEERFPEVPNVACFDTAFHRRMPAVAQRLPLPEEFWEQGIRRYGFHGLSYEYILENLGPGAMGRLIIAHLGNGASMAAVRDGKPVDTTMSFTPNSGLMMGTRCGDLDPGVFVHLVREMGYTTAQVSDLVTNGSGLLGVSGFSSDMQALLEQRKCSPAASLAVALFCYNARKAIGGLAAALGGVETLVFTGGIGEHAAEIRSEICAGLEFLGISIEPERNSADAPQISPSGSRCAVRVIPTNEELMIGRHTARLLSAAGSKALAPSA